MSPSDRPAPDPGALGAPVPSGAPAVRIGPRSALVVALVSIVGLAAFTWPLLVAPATGSSVGHAGDAPVVFLVLLPVLLAVALAEFTDGGLDSRALAMLAVLAAVGAALRPLGAGTAGIETVFFLLILGGRVMGPGFGFLLGTITLFSSAVLTGGVGPWLPFQMLAAGWVGMGAGLLPGRVRGRGEVVMLVAYGIASAYAFGLLMNLWFWPFVAGTDSRVSFVAGAPLGENLRRLLAFSVVTSLAWDTGRAITTTVLVVLAGPAVLGVLRRAARRAAFAAPVGFEPGPVPPLTATTDPRVAGRAPHRSGAPAGPGARRPR